MGCAQKLEFQVFGSKDLGRENKLEKNYFLLYLSLTFLSPPVAYLPSLERFQKFEERIQIDQEEGLHAS